MSKKKSSSKNNALNFTETSNKTIEFDKFLHEPNRLQIIAQLYSLEEADMIYLKNNLDITWGNLSFHATALEEKGYLTISKQFIGKKPYTVLKITNEGKLQFEKYKQNMMKLLT